MLLMCNSSDAVTTSQGSSPAANRAVTTSRMGIKEANMNNYERDCKTCIHRVPILDEGEGIWRGADCDSWDCEYVSRKEALQAWNEKNGGRE